jgi:iron complex transport system substrate-binding protein
MRRLLVPIVLLAVALAACGRTTGGNGVGAPSVAAFPVTVDTPSGKVTVAKRPQRIVSLSPTATEMLFAIQAGGQVVAVDDNSNYPPGAPRTKLSGFQPNVEAVAGYRPDLVVYSNEAGGLGASLRKLGIPALLQPAATRLDDSYAQLDQLGLVTGHRAEARRVNDSMRGQIRQIVASARPERPLSYYHELDKNLFSVTSRTFIGQLYGLLGLRNIADPADKQGSGYPQLSAEYVLKADPDLIFLADTRCCGQSAATVAARPGWRQLTAVRDGAVVPLDDDIASRWGPRTVDFLRTVATALRSLKAVRS